MLKRIFFFSFLISFIHSSDAQNFLKRFYIKGTLSDIKTEKLYAFEESINGKVLLDSVSISNGKQFELMVKTRNYPGFIYLCSTTEIFQEPLIFFISENCDTIKFNSRGTSFIDSISFINSDNTLLYRHLKLEKKYANKTDKESLKKYAKELSSLKTGNEKHPSSKFLYTYFLIKHDLKTPNRTVAKESLIKINQQIELLNSDILEIVFANYIQTFENKNSHQTEMEITLQDSFLNLMKSHLFKQTLVVKFGTIFISYLQQKKYYTALGNYLSNAPYIPAEYEPVVYPKLIAGENIPSIKGLSFQGNPVDINEINSEYKIIFIWSPDCEHCMKSMPDMNLIYEERKQSNIQFYGFSILKLDSSTQQILKWGNSANILLGWENVFLQKYAINYTPIILLLDKNNNIIANLEDGLKLRIALLKLK